MRQPVRGRRCASYCHAADPRRRSVGVEAYRASRSLLATAAHPHLAAQRRGAFFAVMRASTGRRPTVHEAPRTPETRLLRQRSPMFDGLPGDPVRAHMASRTLERWRVGLPRPLAQIAVYVSRFRAVPQVDLPLPLRRPGSRVRSRRLRSFRVFRREGRWWGRWRASWLPFSGGGTVGRHGRGAVALTIERLPSRRRGVVALLALTWWSPRRSWRPCWRHRCTPRPTSRCPRRDNVRCDRDLQLRAPLHGHSSLQTSRTSSSTPTPQTTTSNVARARYRATVASSSPNG